MPFAFEKREDPGKGARRLSHEGARLALDLLEGPAYGAVGRRVDPLPDPVHETRKVLKRLRALVRLCAGAIGKKQSKAIVSPLREAARILAGPRDAAIVRATFEALSKRKGAPHDAQPVLDLLPAPPPLSPDSAHDAATAVRAFEGSIGDWSFRGREGFGVIEEGLLHAYRDGRRELEIARRTWAPKDAHELRKFAKDLRFDVELVAAAWPEMLEPLAGELDRLGEILGEDHDLAVLGGRLNELDVASEWLHLIDDRRDRLRKKALPLARRIYAEKPDDFVDRIASYF